MFGKKLRLLMAYKDINQREMAEILGVTQALVSNWLKNKKMPSIRLLKKMAEYFNISIDRLVEDFDLDQDPDKIVRDLKSDDLTTKDLTDDELTEELIRACEGLDKEVKQDLLEVAEKLSERIKKIGEIQKRSKYKRTK